MIKKVVVLSALLVVAAVPSLQAQRSGRGSGPMELGIDGGVSFGLDNPKVTVVGLPVQTFRVGFPMTDRLAVEPRLSINSIHAGGGSFTTYALEVGLVYSPSGDRVGNGLYGRPFIGVAGVNTSGPGDDSNAYMGLGIGLKIPFADRRLATRMEANYAHGFGTPSTNAIGLLIGLSFFTR
jgi:outer membrane protein with beta-barrel domain